MRSRRNYSLGRQFVSESVAKTFSDEKREEKLRRKNYEGGRALSARMFDVRGLRFDVENRVAFT
jgi:hypothetical protein